MAVPMSPILALQMTLKDALSMMLDANVQAGIAVDRAGRVLGLVTTDLIATFLRDSGPLGGTDPASPPPADPAPAAGR